ncbi:hypothetical protein [Kocuria rosea]|uniref:hypothetical protein n=1 Tax=Kocuria rosea TaxID=1275 RepID=UPI002B24D7E8|nr:hypothetical protein [Kocuria rosea]MEB2528657.1 hypothetical protein [Kocuria rosea]MEB2620074.1 hypothetical protein [Kocuria rosea]
MAQRRSATKTEARERARKAAAEAIAREERLLELGEEFFVAQGEAEQIMENAEQRIAEIRAKAEQEAAEAKASQARVVAGMRDERVAATEIAQRLELSAAGVRALLKDLPVVTATSGAGESAEDGSDVVSDGAEVSVRESVNA